MLLQSHAKALGSTAHRTLRLPNSTTPVTNSSHRHVPTTHPASHTNSRYPAATKSHHNGGLRATSDSNVRLKRKWRHSLASGHRVVLLLNLAAHSRLISNCFKEPLSSSKILCIKIASRANNFFWLSKTFGQLLQTRNNFGCCFCIDICSRKPFLLWRLFVVCSHSSITRFLFDNKAHLQLDHQLPALKQYSILFPCDTTRISFPPGPSNY